MKKMSTSILAIGALLAATPVGAGECAMNLVDFLGDPTAPTASCELTCAGSDGFVRAFVTKTGFGGHVDLICGGPIVSCGGLIDCSATGGGFATTSDCTCEAAPFGARPEFVSASCLCR
jgi:hypothetical protein